MPYTRMQNVSMSADTLFQERAQNERSEAELVHAPWDGILWYLSRRQRSTPKQGLWKAWQMIPDVPFWELMYPIPFGTFESMIWSQMYFSSRLIWTILNLSRSGLLQMTKLKVLDSSNLDSTSNPTRLSDSIRIAPFRKRSQMVYFYSPWWSIQVLEFVFL